MLRKSKANFWGLLEENSEDWSLMKKRSLCQNFILEKSNLKYYQFHSTKSLIFSYSNQKGLN